MVDKEQLNRLRWQCRRGMLELDFFLQKFLEHSFVNLSEADQQLFTRLLESTDQDLFVWLTGRETPSDPEFARMVKFIRERVQVVR